MSGGGAVALDAYADQPIWVCWQKEERDGRSTKVPWSPNAECHASSAHPSTWNTRAIAERSALANGRTGIGIVLAPLGEGRHLGGIDLDSCLDADRNLAPWAREIVELVASYAEISPGGHGLKIFFEYDPRETLAENVRWRSAVRQPALEGGKDHAIEFYLDRRYFTVTNRIFESFDAVRLIDLDTLREVQALMEVFADKVKTPTDHPHHHDDDQQRIIDALFSIPREDDYNEWVRIGMALHSDVQGSPVGYRAFVAWSARSKKFNAHHCQQKWQEWDRNPARDLTGGTIVFLARQNGWRDPRRARANGAAAPSTLSGTGNAPTVGEDAKVKPRLLVDAANPDLTVAALRDILRKSGNLYDRGVPVRLAFDQAQRGMAAQVLTPDVLVLLAHSACRPYRIKTTADGEKTEVDTRLPRDIATMYLGWQGEWQLPVLNGIASAPMLKDDGTILASVGYDQASGMWCDDLPALGVLVPEAPTKEEAVAALALLRQTFRTFCFADAETVLDHGAGVVVVAQDRPPGHDESAALAGLLTAVCRPSLDLAPATVVDAPAISGAGTGKGMLARCIALIAFGREPHAVTGGGDSNETDKRIAAELMEGHPMLFLDNLNNAAFRSDLLASVITERPSRVRVLGLSKMVQMNSSAFVVLTGNGLSVAEDMARRVITARLDAKTEDPEARPFKSNLREEVLAKRPELLAALLTIWRWGRLTTLPSGKPLGSFERWTRWVRDPLLALGCKDVVEQVSRAKARDAERQFVGELFETWRDRHGDSPVAIRNLHEDVSKILDPQGRGRQFIASKVRKLIDTRAAGFTLTRQAGSGKWSTTTYALMLAGDPEGHRGHRGHRPEGSAPVPPEANGATPVPPMTPMHPSASAEADVGKPINGEASTAPVSPDPTQSASNKPKWRGRL